MPFEDEPILAGRPERGAADNGPPLPSNFATVAAPESFRNVRRSQFGWLKRKSIIASSTILNLSTNARRGGESLDAHGIIFRSLKMPAIRSQEFRHNRN